MEWTEIISVLGGGAGIGTMLWYAINLQAKKKIERAHAQSVEAEADSKVSDNWQAFAEKLEHEYMVCKEEYRQLDERMLKLERDLNRTLTQKHYAEYHICTDLACVNRKPPLGEFHTPDHNEALKGYGSH